MKEVGKMTNKKEEIKDVQPCRKGDKPITRIQAYRQLNKEARMADITDGIGNPHHEKNVQLLALQTV
jgi:hypothetical protein